jgi:ABC-2 type transport system ATP-binding protein
VASLDPLARRDFLQDLTDAVAEHQMSVVLSSHLISDLEHACDYLVVLIAGHVRLIGGTAELLAVYRQQAGMQAGLEDLVLACLSQPADPRYAPEENR